MLGHLWLSSVLSVLKLSLMKYFPILLMYVYIYVFKTGISLYRSSFVQVM